MNRKEQRLRRLRSAFQVAIDRSEKEVEELKPRMQTPHTGVLMQAIEHLRGLREGLEIAEFVIREEQ